jgi:Tfp pilus assembly protein PilX
MNKYLSTVANERGTALLIVVVLVPVLTLFCIFASNVSVQDMLVTANDNCHRYALYDADGAVYATSKLISLIAKSDSREAVEDGVGQDAPGVQYLNTDSDPAAYFASMMSSPESKKTAQDVKFLKTTDTATDPDEKDFGLGSTVDIEKDWSKNDEGGGAEFGNAYGGIGSQLIKVRFRISARTIDAAGMTGGSVCPDTDVQVNGDYWLIVAEDGQTKGI